MIDVIRRLVAICAFQNGPQDLPASWNLLLVAVAMDVALGYPAAMAYSPSAYPGVQIFLGTLLAGAFVYGALSVVGHTPRFVQTATAVFGTDAVITLFALPIALTMEPGARTVAGPADFGILLIGIWNIAIIGHILRHALSVTMGMGVLVALAYTLAAVLITGAVTG